MTQKRRKHSGAFKARVALEAVRGVKTINQIAAEHEIHPVQVSQWKKELETRMAETFYKIATGASDCSKFISRLVDKMGPLGKWIDKYFDALVWLMNFGETGGEVGTVSFNGSQNLEKVIAERKRREAAGEFRAAAC